MPKVSFLLDAFTYTLGLRLFAGTNFSGFCNSAFSGYSSDFFQININFYSKMLKILIFVGIAIIFSKN